MARKRMFDNDIINQDNFLDLPSEAKALYFLLGMEADDEGFVVPKRVLRLHNINNDNLKILIAKKYLIPFETGVVVITDWKRNNYLDKNKIKPTIYVEELKQLMFDMEKQKYIQKQEMPEVKTELNPSLPEVKTELTQYSIEENNYNEQKQILLDHFEKIWNIYPHKKGKAKAQEFYLQWIKGKKVSGITRKLTDEEMYYAVLKYKTECEENSIEQKYIKHGDTFFNKAILDYVEEENE